MRAPTRGRPVAAIALAMAFAGVCVAAIEPSSMVSRSTKAAASNRARIELVESHAVPPCQPLTLGGWNGTRPI